MEILLINLLLMFMIKNDLNHLECNVLDDYLLNNKILNYG